MGDPILIDCEGSRCWPAADIGTDGMCSMCGGIHAVDETGRIVAHQRDDILARLARGDFDA